MEPQLSALTDDVVDRLYNISGAAPEAHPVFLWLVGTPGAGKSTGHAKAIAEGLLPAGNYATINLDTLLESLLPFRAASSMGYYVKRALPEVEAKFSSISAYGTRKENLGLFKWYDTARADLVKHHPTIVKKLNSVRAQFEPLRDREAEAKLIDLNDTALARAIRRSVPIVYETTLSLNKSGTVTKVDDLMKFLKKEGPQYRVVFYMVYGAHDEVAARIEARQEYGMPYEEMPFYRYVSVKPETVAEMTAKMSDAFAAVQKKYGKHGIVFEKWNNRLDPARLPREREFNAPSYLNRIVSAYGLLDSNWKVSTPRSTNSLRYSTPSSERRRRRTSSNSLRYSTPTSERRRSTRKKRSQS